MDFTQIEVIEALSIDNVELFETFKDSGLLLTRGTLQLLYAKDYDWFILKINDFNYGLNKKMPLLASSIEPGAARTYVLPTKDSYYVLKIAYGTDVAFSKLDDIFTNYTDFAYKEGERGAGLPIELEGATVKIKKIRRDPNSRRNLNLAQIIFEGGNSIEKLMVNTAEMIVGGITKVTDLGELSYEEIRAKKDMPIETKTVSRWALVNSATGMSANMSTSYIKGLLSLSAAIAQWFGQQYEKKEFEREIEEIKEKERQRVKRYEQDDVPQIDNIIRAAVHSIFTVWHGMAEALQIISAGVGESTSKFVGRNFGPLAGEVFKAGVGAVGATVRVPKLPGQKYLRYLNRF